MERDADKEPEVGRAVSGDRRHRLNLVSPSVTPPGQRQSVHLFLPEGDDKWIALLPSSRKG